MSRPALESDLGRAVVAAADQLAQELGYGM